MGNLDDELEGSQRHGQGLWIHAVPMTSHTSCRFDAVDPNGTISEDHASVSAKQFHICQGYALGRTHLFVSCNSLSFVAWNVWSFLKVVGTLKTLSPRVWAHTFEQPVRNYDGCVVFLVPSFHIGFAFVLPKDRQAELVWFIPLCSNYSHQTCFVLSLKA